MTASLGTIGEDGLMMLTTKGRYAVMALLELASLSAKEEPITLAELSKAQEIPLKYLEQIFRRLKNARLVKAIKGPGGGYVLAEPLDKINIANIIDAVNENIKMTRCSVASESGCMNDKTKCRTHHLWQGLGDHIRNYFAGISVADLIMRPEQINIPVNQL